MKLKFGLTRTSLAAILAGVAALGATATATLGSSAFTASVAGSGSTFQSGTLLLSETANGTTCLSNGTNTAASIVSNALTGCAANDLSTGTSNVISTTPSLTTVTLTNQGSVASTTGVTLTTSACTVTAAPWASSPADNLASGSDTSGYCGNVWMTVSNGTKCIYPAQAGACPSLSSSNTLAGFVTAETSGVNVVSSLAAGASVTLTVSYELGTSATNADQGLLATVPVTYTLNQ